MPGPVQITSRSNGPDRPLARTDVQESVERSTELARATRDVGWSNFVGAFRKEFGPKLGESLAQTLIDGFYWFRSDTDGFFLPTKVEEREYIFLPRGALMKRFLYVKQQRDGKEELDKSFVKEVLTLLVGQGYAIEKRNFSPRLGARVKRGGPRPIGERQRGFYRKPKTAETTAYFLVVKDVPENERTRVYADLQKKPMLCKPVP